MGPELSVFHNDSNITKESMATLFIQGVQQTSRVLNVCSRNQFSTLHAGFSRSAPEPTQRKSLGAGPRAPLLPGSSEATANVGAARALKAQAEIGRAHV